MATNWRVLAVAIAVIISFIFINPQLGVDGVAVRSVDSGSTAAAAGMESPDEGANPTNLERILEVNGQEIHSIADYTAATANLQIGDAVSIVSTEHRYRLNVRAETQTITLAEQEEQIITDDEGNNQTILVNLTEEIDVGVEDLGIQVTAASSSNIRRGLDLQGGTRVLLQTTEEISDEDFELLLAGLNERLNVFGLSDIAIRGATDLDGRKNVLVEIPGADEEAVRNLLLQEGKFEAKILDETIFTGGKDIVDVCKSAECSGLDPQAGCVDFGGQWSCRFRFTITMTQEAAESQRAALQQLDVVGGSLSAPLQLFLDGELVDELSIAADLQNSVATTISISGTGEGSTRNNALQDMNVNMRRLQTILITGSLPVSIEIAQTDSISPVLGETFLRNAFLMGAIAILVVISILMAVYRNFKVAIPMMLTSLLEIFILLGIASAIKWSVDIAAIAGIIAAIGSGVNDQIVITDEAIRGDSRHVKSWTEKFRNSIFIIMGAFWTLFFAMLPLFFIGAGLLRGFALTTIIGTAVGVFLTRPAYAKIVEILLKE